MIQVFDDGTQIEYNAAGDVVSYTDLSGAVRLPDTSIVNDFVNTIAQGFLGEVRRAFNPAPPAQAASAAGTRTNGLAQLALLALGGVLLYKLVS
jgi:hypothetical protein